MADYGLTAEGFVPKRLDEIIADLDSGMIEIYGAGFDNNPDTPNGQFIALFAEALADGWEHSANGITMLSPSHAIGALLSWLVQINGLKRKGEIRTNDTCVFLGTPNAVVPQGTVVSDGSNAFETTVAATIGGGGSVDVLVEASDRGPIPLVTGGIDTIVTKFAGLTSVLNPYPSPGPEIGQIGESDADVRRRREVSTEQGAVNTLESLRARARALDGVADIKVLVNEDIATDGDGVPGKSYEMIALGGADAELAQVQWDTHPFGIASNGSTTVNVIDSEGEIQPMKFSRPTNIPIYVIVNITTTAEFPANGDQLMKDYLLDFVAGNLAGYEDEKLGISDDVIHSRLYTPLNLVPGHSIDDLFIGTAPSPTLENDIAIDVREYSEWLEVNIAVVPT